MSDCPSSIDSAPRTGSRSTRGTRLLAGRLPAAHPMFNTPGLNAIAVTAPGGEPKLAAAALRPPAAGGETSAAARAVPARVGRVIEHRLDPEGLRRAHQRLTAQFGVRYLACE